MELKEVEISVTQAQRAVILHEIDPEKTLQIVSGPGAGKTTTLVYKIAYMIGHLNIPPEDILVLSMTNKAVDHIKNGVFKILGQDDILNITTFHGFCHKLLINKDEFYNNLEIIEDSGWRTIIQLLRNKRLTKYHLQRLVKDLKVANPNIPFISKSHKVSVDDINQLLSILSKMKVLTHTDILFTTKQLLKAGLIKTQHKVIIVDEFQDMYQDLFELVKLISVNSHLVIAGDPNQSIYGFLGSNTKVLSELTEFKPIDRVELTESFRSSPEILNASKHLLSIGPQDDVFETNSILMNAKTDIKPIWQSFDTSTDQYEFVASEILRLIKESNHQIKPRDIAILASTNLELARLNKILKFYGLQSYKLTSSPSWLSNETFHLLDYLRILINPYNSDFAILSTLSLVPRIGPITIRKLYEESQSENVPLFQILEISKDLKIIKYCQTINSLRANINLNDSEELFNKLLNLGLELGLSDKLSKSIKDHNDKSELLAQLVEFKENLKKCLWKKPLDINLAQYFITNYSNLLPKSLTNSQNSVQISTIHSSKGLEFPIVFLLNVKLHTNMTVEDKKLLYVGMTRAKNLLYLNKVKPEFPNFVKQDVKVDSNYFQFNKPLINERFVNGLNPVKLNFQRSFSRYLRISSRL